ncbi:unnamed protein product [Amoebophrya sp. A25]|nr:unnamed protein product [Amoebophrya sp. A25]|eukprot:GSA25T00003690001.1
MSASLCGAGSLLGSAAFQRRLRYGFEAMAVGGGGTVGGVQEQSMSARKSGGAHSANSTAAGAPSTGEQGPIVVTAYRIDRLSVQKMERQKPALALIIQKVLLQDVSVCYL